MKKQNEEINKKQETKEFSMKEEGITLIALVVTIIVLLILAGVSIAMLTGEGGIIKQAEEAKDRTGRANLIETVQMEIFEKITTSEGSLSEEDLHDILSKYFSNVPDIELEEWTNFPEGFPKLTATKENGSYDIEIGEIYGGKLNNANEEGKYLKPGEKAQTTTKNNYKDENNKLATVPKDFHVSTKEGEKNVEDGLVIIDDDGNEFVWIPCVVDEYKKYDEFYKNYQNGYTNYDDWKEEADIEENKKSINEYGGFYVARYEAGIPENANFYPSEKNKYKYYTSDIEDGITKNTTAYNPVSKKNYPSWNYISQPNAKIVSENMYKESKSVRSQLIDNYAWDTMANWINKEFPGKTTTSDASIGNYETSKFKINGIYAVHNYKKEIDKVNEVAKIYEKGEKTVGQKNVDDDTIERIEIATGSAEDTKIRNIYDLAGNMFEYTTEIRDSGNSVVRGGRFDWARDVIVFYWNVQGSRICVGFRVVLYVE